MVSKSLKMYICNNYIYNIYIYIQIYIIYILKGIFSYIRVIFRKVTKIDMYHMSMMLECNLKLVGRLLCLQMPEKVLINLYLTQYHVEKLKAYILL